MTNAKATILPPAPDLGNPERNLRDFRRILSESTERNRQGWNTHAEIRAGLEKKIARTVTGSHGWSIVLFGWEPREMTVDIDVAEALCPVLVKIGDWMEEVLAQRAMNCPEPQEARRQSYNTAGLPKLRKTVRQNVGRVSSIEARGLESRVINIDGSMIFDGQAKPTEVIWPVHIWRLLHQAEDMVRSALGLPMSIDGKNPNDEGNGWENIHTIPKRATPGMRFHHDFQDMTREERETFEKLVPEIFQTDHVWTTGSHLLKQKTCQLQECREGGQCSQAWRTHSQAVFQAFMEANPNLQYKDVDTCVIEVGEKRHICDIRTHSRIQGKSLDHHELCRFPDGQKIIISHPCQGAEGNDFRNDLEGWRGHVPSIDMLTLEPGKSWYLPGQSQLVIVGRREILERLNTGYPTPEEAIPAGCARSRNH